MNRRSRLTSWGDLSNDAPGFIAGGFKRWQGHRPGLLPSAIFIKFHRRGLAYSFIRPVGAVRAIVFILIDLGVAGQKFQPGLDIAFRNEQGRLVLTGPGRYPCPLAGAFQAPGPFLEAQGIGIGADYQFRPASSAKLQLGRIHSAYKLFPRTLPGRGYPLPGKPMAAFTKEAPEQTRGLVILTQYDEHIFPISPAVPRLAAHLAREQFGIRQAFRFQASKLIGQRDYSGVRFRLALE